MAFVLLLILSSLTPKASARHTTAKRPLLLSKGRLVSSLAGTASADPSIRTSLFHEPLWITDHEVLARVSCANGALAYAYRLDTRSGRITQLARLTAVLGGSKPGGWSLTSDHKAVIWEHGWWDDPHEFQATTLDGKRSHPVAHPPRRLETWLDDERDNVGHALLKTGTWWNRHPTVGSSRTVRLPVGFRATEAIISPSGRFIAWEMEAADRHAMARIGTRSIWLSGFDGHGMRLLGMVPSPYATLNLHCWTPDSRSLLCSVDHRLYSVAVR